MVIMMIREIKLIIFRKVRRDHCVMFFKFKLVGILKIELLSDIGIVIDYKY
jgi:hypothetical protein